MSYFEPPGDELRDDEYPDEPRDDEPGDDDSDTIDCPECGTAVYDDAEQCPHCGRWLTDADRSSGGHPLAGRPVWWILLGLLGLIATVVVLSGWW